ncbi:MAG: SoxR reducing system RseC family protein [Sedimentibacter sp.]|uniref:SoxR reducing system RseC family protein n=1 Tax=Sedimentibacter sp. TaxID=1960295 RepID=UPI00315977DE
MTLIGIIEKKNGKDATILIKKELPCKDRCRHCSAGCHLYSERIVTQVTDDLQPGDRVEIEARGEAEKANRLMQYLLPLTLMAVSIAAVQGISVFKNKEAFSALGVFFSLVASQLVIYLHDRRRMKEKASKFLIGKKLSDY